MYDDAIDTLKHLKGKSIQTTYGLITMAEQLAIKKKYYVDKILVKICDTVIFPIYFCLGRYS